MWVVGHATPYATAAATKLLLFPRKLESHEMPLWSSLPPVLGPLISPRALPARAECLTSLHCAHRTVMEFLPMAGTYSSAGLSSCLRWSCRQMIGCREWGKCSPANAGTLCTFIT